MDSLIWPGHISGLMHTKIGSVADPDPLVRDTDPLLFCFRLPRLD